MSILPPNARKPEDALRVLGVLAGLLDAHEATWWVDYGTLLGAAREGHMIAHDSDVDLGVMSEDFAGVVNLAPHLSRHGFKTCYHAPAPTRFESGDYFAVTREPGNPNGVDVFPWYREGGALDRRRYDPSDLAKGRAFLTERLFPLQRITFEGIEVNAPRDLEWFAKHRYGPNWRTPVDYFADGSPSQERAP